MGVVHKQHKWKKNTRKCKNIKGAIEHFPAFEMLQYKKCHFVHFHIVKIINLQHKREWVQSLWSCFNSPSSFFWLNELQIINELSVKCGLFSFLSSFSTCLQTTPSLPLDWIMCPCWSTLLQTPTPHRASSEHLAWSLVKSSRIPHWAILSKWVCKRKSIMQNHCIAFHIIIVGCVLSLCPS